MRADLHPYNYDPYNRPKGHQGATDDWEIAVRTTDNRLRAMRFHIEDSKDSKEAVDALKDDLQMHLASLASHARTLDDYDAVSKIETLKDAVIEMVPTADTASFAAVYARIGVSMPKTVRNPDTRYDYTPHRERRSLGLGRFFSL